LDVEPFLASLRCASVRWDREYREEVRMIRGIHHFALHTPRFDAMKRFYREAFGFEQAGPELSWTPTPEGDATIGVKNAAGRTLLVKSKNCYLELFEYFSPPPRDAGPAQPNDHGYTHFCVEVTDIEGEFARLEGLGMTFTAEKPLDLGYVKAVYGRDPDGNVIELQEFSESDDRAYRQLACFQGARP
jgi:catechol 2,3-dioxygenase-like lactoylglutathione lyase family enzyme